MISQCRARLFLLFFELAPRGVFFPIATRILLHHSRSDWPVSCFLTFLRDPKFGVSFLGSTLTPLEKTLIGPPPLRAPGRRYSLSSFSTRGSFPYPLLEFPFRLELFPLCSTPASLSICPVFVSAQFPNLFQHSSVRLSFLFLKKVLDVCTICQPIVCLSSL